MRHMESSATIKLKLKSYHALLVQVGEGRAGAASMQNLRTKAQHRQRPLQQRCCNVATKASQPTVPDVPAPPTF